MKSGLMVIALLGSLAAGQALAQEADLRDVFSAPVGIEREVPVVRAPLEVRHGKLFVNAAFDGQSREFIFDTGSPTILSRQFAQTLDLEVIGRNTGVDANGNEVTMDVARVGTVSLDGVVFHDVPVMIFDFSTLAIGACMIDGGVLGSEILPGSAWRIDTETGQLAIAEAADTLEAAQPVLRARLHDFGYPHAPIIDYQVGDVSDRALIDTGSAATVALFARLAENPAVRGLIDRESLREGRGYEGESASGLGPVRPLARFTLGEFRIGESDLGPQVTHLRAVPPTLVGAGLLDRYAATLDYVGGQFLLELRDEEAEPSPWRGFSIAWDETGAVISQLYADSAAASAGLQLEDRVVTFNDRVLSGLAGDARCDALDTIMTSLATPAAVSLQVERNGDIIAIEVPPLQD